MSENPVKLNLKPVDASSNAAAETKVEAPKPAASTIKLNLRNAGAPAADAATPEAPAAGLKIAPAKSPMTLKKDDSPKVEASIPPGLEPEPVAEPVQEEEPAPAAKPAYEMNAYAESDDIGAMGGLSTLLGTIAAAAAVALVVMVTLTYL